MRIQSMMAPSVASGQIQATHHTERGGLRERVQSGPVFRIKNVSWGGGWGWGGDLMKPLFPTSAPSLFSPSKIVVEAVDSCVRADEHRVRSAAS